ncbi:MAG TPA: sensor domain-containing diguanylate cyclase [Azospirillaceae bacterium]|nr:sensor domain-containing diguanylate cyclase [Azospirillaceae bacterium]
MPAAHLPAPLPANEAERLASVRAMRLLDTPDEAALDRVTRTARRLFDMPIALFSVLDAERQWFKSCVGLPLRETGRDVSFCGHAAAEEAMLVVEDAAADPRFAGNPLVTGEPHVRFYAGRPVRNADGMVVGTLCVIDRRPRRFGPEDRLALDDLAGWLELLLARREIGESQRQLLAALDEAERRTLIDPMLNCWNRRGMALLLEREAARTRTAGGGLLVALGDLDRFKSINDTYGHPAGDAVIAEAVRRLRGAVRATDAVGRWGGEEFLVVAPACTAAMALDLARRMCEAVGGGGPVRHDGREIAATISIGAVFVEAPALRLTDMDALVARADEALYAAKRDGRNRAVVAPLSLAAPAAVP